MNESKFLDFSPEELIILYTGFYNEQYGNKKAEQILQRIFLSKKVDQYIDRLRTEKLTPGTDGFITLVNSIPFFLFSKGETLCYGSLIAIQKWSQLSYNDDFKLSFKDIHHIVVKTIFKASNTKFKVSAKHNFFDDFFILLEDVLHKKYLNFEKNRNSEFFFANETCIYDVVIFDPFMFDAISYGVKKEFRIMKNLEEINRNPDFWTSLGTDERGAIFMNDYSKQIVVSYPYKAYSSIIAENIFGLKKYKLELSSCWIQRVQSVSEEEALKEGMKFFDGQTEEIYDGNDFSLADNFRLYWIEKFGYESYENNNWIWIYEFEIV